MRFVAVSTIFAAVVTLAIHGVSASSVGTVKQTDQVNQGASYLSKKEETTCAFEDGAKHISLEKKEQLYAILTKLHGSDAGCQVTNALLRLFTSPEFSKLPGKDSRIDNKSSFDTGPDPDSDNETYSHRPSLIPYNGRLRPPRPLPHPLPPRPLPHPLPPRPLPHPLPPRPPINPLYDYDQYVGLGAGHGAKA
jgi:hypothetical protein